MRITLLDQGLGTFCVPLLHRIVSLHLLCTLIGYCSFLVSHSFPLHLVFGYKKIQHVFPRRSKDLVWDVRIMVSSLAVCAGPRSPLCLSALTLRLCHRHKGRSNSGIFPRQQTLIYGCCQVCRSVQGQQQGLTLSEFSPPSTWPDRAGSP